MVENLDRAGKIFRMMVLLEDTPSTPGVIGVGDVVRFLTGGMPSLTADQTRYLFSRPDLRRVYADLKRDLSVASMPEVAAASTGDATVRNFEGGELRISVTSQPNQFKVRVTLEESKREHRVCLALEHPEGGLERLDFEFAPDQSGIVVKILDETDARSARILAMIRDNGVKGEFLRFEPPGP